jgi:hypothetical protein
MKNHIEYLCTDRDFWHRGNKGVVEDRPANSEYLQMFGLMGPVPIHIRNLLNIHQNPKLPKIPQFYPNHFDPIFIRFPDYAQKIQYGFLALIY